MSFGFGTCQATEDDRDGRIRRVIEEVIHRRAGGEAVDDDALARMYPDLLPELQERISSLGAIEKAQRTAMRQGSVAGDQPPAGRQVWSKHCLAGYEMAQQIQRGGQAVLFRATQLATGRQVAIKVMQEGPLVGPRDRARFDREVRVLAHLRHPNIVPILDSGYVDGCRFFVMDYIAGVTLDDYVTTQRPDVNAILRLFVKILRPVHAAHLRGIIHRDLKPTNILIDSQGEPHVLDFGLAKIATEEIHEATEWRHMTLTGQFVGTLPWASPEQADGPVDRVDLRTDIYSLGVILYHVLSGAFPYPVAGKMQEVVRHISETPPARLTGQKHRVDEDLETIVLKCLAKEPERRYQSVAAVIDDIERYLRHQPILARAPSTIYQLKKLIRRHKWPFALASLALLSLAAFAASMGLLYRRTAILLDRAQRAESMAQQGRAQAQDEAAKTQAINNFMSRVLQFQSPWKREHAPLGAVKTAGRDVKLSELLDEAVTWFESDFVGRPDLEATVRLNLGQGFLEIGREADAGRHIAKALGIRQELFGEHDPRTLECRLALPAVTPRSWDEEQLVRRQNWETCREALGDHHSLTFQAAKARVLGWFITPENAADWEQFARRTIAIQKEAFDPPYDPAVQSYLARLLVLQNRLDEAESLAAETMEMARQQGGPDDFWGGFNNIILAHIDRFRGNFGEAERRLRETIELLKRTHGYDHEVTALPILRLGQLLYATGRFDEAEPVLREAMEMSVQTAGTAGSYTHVCVFGLGRVLQAKGRLVEAEQLYRQWFDDCYRDRGAADARTLEALAGLAEFLRRDGRPLDAEPLARTAVEGLQPPPERREFSGAAQTLACVLCDLRRPDEAEPFFARSVAALEKQIVTDPMILPTLQLQYGRCLIKLIRYAEAESLLQASRAAFHSLPAETDNLALSAQEAITELHDIRQAQGSE